ncbi:ParB/RepB/Spo0J family partition protein [Herbaspirillum sp. ST 5-3]|uniref:ParB/RepB/Spo0J family partition protein n=1 Tax=Oxalobacteraceae TaxID=75682 RepID=UPI0010A4C4F7|nr:ParB/RepB/Spo0J family partition protein [Herbaspirillum sp. ST 5-3]
MNAPETHIAAPLFGIIPRTHIRLGIWNPRKRITEAELQELAESIRLHGLMQPILVRPIAGEDDMYELVFGERRFRAAEIAALDGIPCQVRVMTDKEVRIAQNIENLQRQDVHPIEEAEGYELLMREDGYTADQLAEETGKSRSYIYGRLKLCALAPSAREAFYDGKLSASAALLVARIPVESLQEHATQEILNDGDPMSYRAAVEHIQERYMLNLDRARFSIKDAKLVKEAGSCEECPKRTGNQPMIYGDVSADICTDPNCFASKSRAHDDKVLEKAQKKGIPVYEGEEAKEFLDDTELVSTDDRLYQFERKVDLTAYNKFIEDVLPPEQLPTPVAYVRIDGKVKPMFEPTAMQVALEKAGVCESEEAIAARQDAQRASVDPAKAAEQEEKKRQQEETLQRKAAAADAETNVRVTAYRKIREAFKSGLPVAAWRVLAKEMLIDHSAPNTLLPDVYQWERNSDEDTIAFIEQASAEELQLLVMDMMFGNTLSVNQWEVHEDGGFDDESEEYQAFIALAASADVDIDALRTEMYPPEKNDEPTEAPKKAKAGRKKKTDTTETPDPAVAWPFPTGVRP